jgi:5-hydroxyisourate hydrolase
VITTHVLDTSRGLPAAGVLVTLEVQGADASWIPIGHGDTDEDGRLMSLIPANVPIAPGVYRIVFDSGHYFRARGTKAFYPSVSIVFETMPGERHYHVPLLLAPFGYSTYRGS